MPIWVLEFIINYELLIGTTPTQIIQVLMATTIATVDIIIHIAS